MSEGGEQSDKTTIAKIGYGHLCLMEENSDIGDRSQNFGYGGFVTLFSSIAQT